MFARTHFLAGLGITVAGALTLTAACSDSPMKTGPSPITARGSTNVTRLAEPREFEICKDYSGITGPSVVFNITVDVAHNGSIDQSFSRTLAGGTCQVIWTTDPAAPNEDFVTVTEVVPAGYTVSYRKSLNGGSPGAPVNSATASGGVHNDVGVLVEFTNTSSPTVVGEGRFTGGGQIELANGVTVSNGLTLHCDLILSNNLEVNWKDANGVQHQFHLEEHLQTIECVDHNNINQNPPPAPLDTMRGVGIGRLDGNDGWTIQFTLVDAGEPGGGNDQIALRIFKGSTVALNFTLQDTTKGNLQAHFDQPHK
jgi:hypothetical protein